METSKNKFTFKIVVSYLLLLVLAGIVTYFVYSEVGSYLKKEVGENGDSKLLRTGSLITQLYEAEGLSKLALQSKEKKDFDNYILKTDSITKDIDQLKISTTSDYQKKLLDSLQILLERKVANNKVLRTLKTKDKTSTAIQKALKEFDQLEESLGVITPKGIAPNIDELSPKAQSVIRDIAKYLNENVPENNKGENALEADSVLQASKALLEEVEKENRINENSLALREITIIKTDLELSQQLRSILTSFEQEILVNTINENIKKETALNRSIRLAIIAAILGFIVVGIFIFILNRDFWKASLYRQKLEKEKKYSEALLKSREQLLGTVSHDLRTPLNAIIGYTHLLEESNISQAQSRHLGHIKSATDYVNNLVNDLLDFSQLEAGKMTLEKVPFSLYSLLMETVEDFRTIHEKKDLTTTLHIDKALKRSIINDPIRIRQIVSNLLGNAYKFTNQGEVRLEALPCDHGKKVKIIISDTGIGISKDEQQQIFNEFTQIKDKDLKKYGGYGLGLTISKKLTELLGGTIGLESDLGKGSTFTLELPVTYSKEKEVPKPKEVREFPLAGFKILIIDDDPSFLQLLGEMLKSENIKTHLFTDFHQIKKDSPLIYDLVLTDIEMPQATGFEVVKKLKQESYFHYKDQPIVAMTGRRDINKTLFLKKGFNDVLIKPFTKTEILNTVYGLISVPKKEDVITIENENHNTSMFQLTYIKSFLGDDEESVQEILKTFREESSRNLEELEHALIAKDYKSLGAISHRMLPMFRQLQITSCIPILEKFEKNNEENLKTLALQLKSLKGKMVQLNAQLDKELN
ncbi:hybrid sensor histidine kinase/response regulator [Maribacter cobaltidurans]|uniref:histidine kinase n=1 Tax=Maribacter cobaltidurans TaxID=1178778 RepID=A0A223V4Z1_9FLAO|nr:ATP-binding protein [Maribacter cobaltidurans]ASV30485.1 hypothetical protein CJ263_09835 [Maribacter cobaltidurans]GGD79148.1 hybrid sensor histidine kinase/response regulator [Maribacter cobaltidurans]